MKRGLGFISIVVFALDAGLTVGGSTSSLADEAGVDTGVWKWRLKSNYPIMGAVTPTAGGLVFFGDMGGNFYALDAATGQKLWGQKIGGAIGGGVITYTVNGAQKVAVATGYVSPALPAEIRRAKIAILGVEGDANRQ
jgi:alcohol dehydrogenase (cytochrome c)